MGLILRNTTTGTGTDRAEEVNLSSTTATATGVTTVDEAIAQLSQDVQNIQITAQSLPVETEQNADFAISNLALYLVNCTASPITVTPPSNPIVDDLFAIADARAWSSVNNITIDFAGAGQVLHGSPDAFILNQDGAYAEFRYIGGEVGWLLISN